MPAAILEASVVQERSFFLDDAFADFPQKRVPHLGRVRVSSPRD
jgi:hypothetical protein